MRIARKARVAPEIVFQTLHNQISNRPAEEATPVLINLMTELLVTDYQFKNGGVSVLVDGTPSYRFIPLAPNNSAPQPPPPPTTSGWQGPAEKIRKAAAKATKASAKQKTAKAPVATPPKKTVAPAKPKVRLPDYQVYLAGIATSGRTLASVIVRGLKGIPVGIILNAADAAKIEEMVDVIDGIIRAHFVKRGAVEVHPTNNGHR